MASYGDLIAAAARHFQSGNLQQAEQACRQILQANPRDFDSLHLFGLIAHGVGQNDLAVDSLRQAARLKPGDVQVLTNLGIVLEAQGKLHEALVSFRQAVQAGPTYAPAQGALGNVLRQLGKVDEALAYCKEAVRLAPDNPETHNNLGSALLDQGNIADADACFRQALQLEPGYLKARSNLGATFIEQGKLDEAIACLNEVLRVQPDHAGAQLNLGNAFREMGKLSDAVACYRSALRQNENPADAHLNLGIIGLLRGDFEHAWPEYEWRWQRRESPPRPFRQSLWDGSSLNGRTILLHAEQGLGDTIQFIRYAPLVKARGGPVIVECQHALLPILARCQGVDQWIGAGSALPDFDVHAPLLSLPRIMGATLGTIPADVPYVFADPELIERWRREFQTIPGFKVGIAWQGSPKNKKDRQRSIPLLEFAPLAQIPGVRFFSLQKGLGAEQTRDVANRFTVADLGGRLDEQRGAFMDTAAVMKNLDLVVTSDTATAHLAGALGVPVWVALSFMPDWRWLLDRDDSPWYPTMRLFRQETRGEWASVFERMAGELAKQTQSPSPAPGILVDIAPGELIDKITILEIKSVRISDSSKLQNVRNELALLAAARDCFLAASPELATLTTELRTVNERLWAIEDDIRACERRGDVGARFIELARSVYRNNDQRATLKRRINELLGSAIVEEKSYVNYQGDAEPIRPTA